MAIGRGVGASHDLSFPIRSVESSLFVDPLVRVGAEIVALGLDQVRRQAFCPESIEIR